MSSLANFKEEYSSKIPALTLLSKLGYSFIPLSGAKVFLLISTSIDVADWKTEQGVTLQDHQVRTIDKAAAASTN